MADRFNDSDLADPELKAKRDNSPEAQRRHEDELIRFGAVAATLYSLVHKLFVPLALKATNVTKTPYKEVDLAWVVPVFFIYALYSSAKNKKILMPIGCGAVIALGFFEVFRYVSGENVGWLVLSRFLSSGPMAFLGVLILVRIASVKNLVYSWIATVVFVVGLYFFEHKGGSVEAINNLGGYSRSVLEIANEKVSDMNACGLKKVIWKDAEKNKVVPQERVSLTVSECGFSPAIQIKNSRTTQFVVSNEFSHSVNVHLWIFSEKGRKRKSKNFIVPPFEKNKKIIFDGLTNAEQVLIVSDTTKEMGLSVLVDEENQADAFSAQSDPPRLEVFVPSQDL